MTIGNSDNGGMSRGGQMSSSREFISEANRRLREAGREMREQMREFDSQIRGAKGETRHRLLEARDRMLEIQDRLRESENYLENQLREMKHLSPQECGERKQDIQQKMTKLGKSLQTRMNGVEREMERYFGNRPGIGTDNLELISQLLGGLMMSGARQPAQIGMPLPQPTTFGQVPGGGLQGGFPQGAPMGIPGMAPPQMSPLGFGAPGMTIGFPMQPTNVLNGVVDLFSIGNGAGAAMQLIQNSQQNAVYALNKFFGSPV